MAPAQFLKLQTSKAFGIISRAERKVSVIGENIIIHLSFQALKFY